MLLPFLVASVLTSTIFFMEKEANEHAALLIVSDHRCPWTPAILEELQERCRPLRSLVQTSSSLLICGGVQLSETDRCDSSELNVCVEMIPRTPIGLPRNKAELDAHCLAYQTGMSCMDGWIKRCLPTDGQKFVQQQIGGARALMRFLCSNETALRKEFLRETTCWTVVSPEWSRCVDELHDAVRTIIERSHHLVYFNKNSELCCTREAFVSCVAYAGRSCSGNAGMLLRRMAWVLAQDVAACTQPHAYCAASAYYAAPLLTITGLILHPARF